MGLTREEFRTIVEVLRKAIDQDVTEGFEKEKKSLESIFENQTGNVAALKEMEYERLLKKIEDEMSKMK
jgi:hypothetical protein